MSEREIEIAAWHGLAVREDDETEVALSTIGGETVMLKIPSTAAYEMIGMLISALGAVYRSRTGSQILIGVSGWRMEAPDPAVDSTILHIETASGPAMALGVAQRELRSLQELIARRLTDLERQQQAPKHPGSRAVN